MFKFIILAVLITSCAAEPCQQKREISRIALRRGMQSRHPWRIAAQANRKFAHDLYQKVSEFTQEDQNFLISPYAVSAGLSMILLGAKEQTADQLMHVLHYKGKRKFSQSQVPKLYEKLWCQLFNMNFGYTLKSINKMYGEVTEDFNENFIDGLYSNYGAKLDRVNFRHNHEDARIEINNWVSNVTNNTIQEAMPPDSVTPSTLLVLLSTLYFKGQWELAFKKTKEGQFRSFSEDGTSYNTQFMVGRFNLNFAENSVAKMIKLPYKSDSIKYKIVMELILPIYHTKQGLIDVENYFTHDNYTRDVKKLRKNNLQKIYLELPKFRLEFGMDLKPVMESMNVVDLFQKGRADLSGINDKRNLHIGTLEHKTFIEVNEQGTTAGASVATGAFRGTPKYMIFNHPFLLVIREEETSLPLFMGRISRPQN